MATKVARIPGFAPKKGRLYYVKGDAVYEATMKQYKGNKNLPDTMDGVRKRRKTTAKKRK